MFAILNARTFLVLVLSWFLLSVSARAGGPLLWQIEGPRGTVYILGTYPTGTKWAELPAMVHEAFHSSRVVATEGLLPLAQERRRMFQILVSQIPAPSFDLRGPAHELFRLAIAPHLPSPMYMHPGFLVPLLDVLGQRIIHQHFVSTQGRDILNYPDGMSHEILQLAKKEHKTPIWLEPRETPLAMQLKEWKIPDVETLLTALHAADARFFTSPELTTSHEGIRQAYNHGDITWLSEWVHRRGLIEGPIGRMYRKSNLRHLSWMSWIESIIQGGSGFIAVDFTHLVGRDHNLIENLKGRGYQVIFWGDSCEGQVAAKAPEKPWSMRSENSLPQSNMRL